MKHITFLIAMVYAIGLHAQYVLPDIEWQTSLGGSAADFLSKNCVISTPDGGYLIGASSYSGATGDKTEANLGPSGTTDYWVIKMDSLGIVQWQNTIGGNGWDILNSAATTSDGGYILAGQSTSGISGDKTEAAIGTLNYDFWIVKINALGMIIWQNTIGGSNDDYPKAVIQTQDGGYLIGGHSYSSNSGDKIEANFGADDFWIVKLNSVGDIQWQNSIGGINSDVLTSMAECLDGSIVIGGSSSSGISTDKSEPNYGGGTFDYWIVKISSTGSILWENTIGGFGSEELNSIIVKPDNTILIAGFSNSEISVDKTEPNIGGYDYWVMALNSSGSIIWQNTIGGTNDDRAYSVLALPDNEYLIGGHSLSGISADKTTANVGQEDYWLVKLESAGNLVWDLSLGGNQGDYLYAIKESQNGGYLLAGTSNSGISGDKSDPSEGSSDVWVIKSSPDINCAALPISDFDLGDAVYSCENSYEIIVNDPYDTYLWNTGGTTNSITVNTTGYYTCSVSQSGCQATDSVFVEISNLTISSSFTPILCNGGTSTVTVLSTGGTGTKNYKIDGSPWQVSNTFTGITAGTHLLKVKDGNSCIESVVLNITQPEILSLTLTAPSISCFGGTTTITANASGGSPGYTYSLNGGIYQVSNIFTGVTSGTHTVHVQDINGCINSANITVTEPAALFSSITASGPTTFCSGGFVTLTVSHNGTTLQWFKNGISIAGATGASYNASTSGTYSCQTSNICGSTTSAGIVVTVNKKPSAIISAGGPTTFCAGGSVVLTANAGAGLSYQWYNGASIIAGATNISYTAVSTGNYKCRVTRTATGCYKDSNKILVTVNCKLENPAPQISISPNPTHGVVGVSFSDYNGTATISVFSVDGKYIYQTEFDVQSNVVTVDISNYANGIYYFNVVTGNNLSSYQIVKIE